MRKLSLSDGDGLHCRLGLWILQFEHLRVLLDLIQPNMRRNVVGNACLEEKRREADERRKEVLVHCLAQPAGSIRENRAIFTALLLSLEIREWSMSHYTLSAYK